MLTTFRTADLTGLSITSSKRGVNCRVRKVFRADPGLDTRQHERPVNKRRQRIRRGNAGSQAELEAFWAQLRRDSIEPENGPEVTQVEECEGYARPRAR